MRSSLVLGHAQVLIRHTYTVVGSTTGYWIHEIFLLGEICGCMINFVTLGTAEIHRCFVAFLRPYRQDVRGDILAELRIGSQQEVHH